MTAASVALWTLLAGPRRPARVMEISGGTVFLWIDPLAGAESRDGRDYPGAVVALLAPDAVRLPIGIVLPPEAAELIPVSVAGSSVSRGEITIGWGAISLGDGRWSGMDWWNPGIPELPLPLRAITGPVDFAPTSGFGSASDSGTAEGLGDGWTASVSGSDSGSVSRSGSVSGSADSLGDGLAALASGAVERAVDLLIGVGDGLIPAGDDVLAGALAALAAWAPDSPARSALVRATAAALGTAKPAELAAGSPSPATPSAEAVVTGRTTPVSAALLQSAATGFAIPEVVAYLTALSTPGSDVDEAQARLSAITLNSGPAIALGIHHQLQALQTGAAHTPTPS
jgi:hypothetical protein